MKTNVELISTRVYAGRLKDRENLNNSSSGGAFTALSDFFLKNGNAVVAAIYNYENHTTEFQMILDKDQRERAKGSKYMQSKPGGIFREAYRWLMDNSGKKMLFVGMGCQSDGFRKFSEIKEIRDRVYIVDIICHGSPSPKLWREYAESIVLAGFMTILDKSIVKAYPYKIINVHPALIPSFCFLCSLKYISYLYFLLIPTK